MNFILKPLVFLSLAVVFFAATPVQAQSKKELEAQNVALAERLTRLESRLLTGDPAAERLMTRIDSLEAAQRALRGELERVAYCLLYTSPSPRDQRGSRMPSSA